MGLIWEKVFLRVAGGVMHIRLQICSCRCMLMLPRTDLLDQQCFLAQSQQGFSSIGYIVRFSVSGKSRNHASYLDWPIEKYVWAGEIRRIDVTKHFSEKFTLGKTTIAGTVCGRTMSLNVLNKTRFKLLNNT